MKYQTHKRQVFSMNLRHGGRAKNTREERQNEVSCSSIPFQCIQKAGKTKKPGTNTELSVLFSFFASRFFSADIDGDDPLCYDMGSERKKT